MRRGTARPAAPCATTAASTAPAARRCARPRRPRAATPATARPTSRRGLREGAGPPRVQGTGARPVEIAGRTAHRRRLPTIDADGNRGGGGERGGGAVEPAAPRLRELRAVLLREPALPVRHLVPEHRPGAAHLPADALDAARRRR